MNLNKPPKTSASGTYEGGPERRLSDREDDESEMPRFELPGILGALPSDQRAAFDGLLFPSVVPWVEEAYVLGVNALFKFVSAALVTEITDYLQLPDGEEKDQLRTELAGKLHEIFWANHDAIYYKGVKEVMDDKKYGKP